MEYVYVILDETEIWGAWTRARDAVRWLLEEEGESCEDLDEAVKEMMLATDYPALIKIPVNPTGEPWCLDR